MLALLFSILFSHAAEPLADVAKLATQLSASDRDTRREAGHQLEKLGPAAKPALPALIAAIGDSDKQVWANALAAIAAIGPDAAEAIPQLVDSFDSRKGSDSRQRDKSQKLMRAAHALARIGDVARPALLEALKADDTGLRLGAAKALGGMGAPARDAIPALIENLGHGDEELRNEVIDTLGLVGADAVAPLTKSLSWPDPKLRIGSARALAAIGGPAASAGSELLARLAAEKEQDVRIAFLGVLPHFGLAQEKIVPPLVQAFRDGDEQLRSAALNGLLLIRPAEKFVVPAIAALLNDPNPAIVERAALALGRFGIAAKSALPPLVNGAARADAQRAAFIAALTEIGGPAVPEVLRQIEKVPGASLNREHWVIRLLSGIGAAGLPELEKALGSPSASVRTAALGALNELGEQSREARPAVLKLTTDGDPFVRATAVSVLVSMATDTGGTLKKIEAAMRDSEPIVRLYAATAAGALGQTARGLAASLTPLLDDKDAAVRAAALRAAGAIGSNDPALAKRLAASLDDPATRSASLSSLAKTGADAATAAKLVQLYPKSEKADRLAILTALGTSATSESLTLFSSALKDPDAEIRAAALRASVKAHPGAESLPILTEALRDAQVSVRRTSAEILGQIGDKEPDKVTPALSTLVAMLAKSEDRVYVLEALRAAHVRDPAAIEQALAIKSSEARAWACERAAKLGKKGKPLVEKLTPLLSDGNDYVRRAARKAIDQLNR
ncbi:MAG: HEAT repeat domain-containing protein [Chthoniobacteraceae bacterium]